MTQIVLGCFVVLLLLAPLYESFDHWDGFPGSGNDTVLNLIGAVTLCGLVLVTAKGLSILLSALVSATWAVDELLRVRSSSLSPGRSYSSIGESPPSLLLCSLRL